MKARLVVHTADSHAVNHDMCMALFLFGYTADIMGVSRWRSANIRKPFASCIEIFNVTENAAECVLNFIVWCSVWDNKINIRGGEHLNETFGSMPGYSASNRMVTKLKEFRAQSSGVTRGVCLGCSTPPSPTKFRSFDTAAFDWKLSRKCLVFLFQHPN